MDGSRFHTDRRRVLGYQTPSCCSCTTGRRRFYRVGAVFFLRLHGFFRQGLVRPCINIPPISLGSSSFSVQGSQSGHIRQGPLILHEVSKRLTRPGRQFRIGTHAEKCRSRLRWRPFGQKRYFGRHAVNPTRPGLPFQHSIYRLVVDAEERRASVLRSSFGS